MSIPENPYASPEAVIEPVVLEIVELSDAEKIRREYINHETSVRSIGSLYYLSAIVPSLAFLGFAMDRHPVPVIASAGLAAIIIAFGSAVRKLRPWTRVPVGIFAVLGLVAVPVGTIISIYILYLVFGRKGRFVYSSEYANVILQTPHIVYRTPAVLKWIVVLIILAVLSAILLPAILVRIR